MTSTESPRVLGIDFGTTNTVIAISDQDGQFSTLRLPTPMGESVAFRSVLSFREESRNRGPSVDVAQWAIEAFQQDPAGARLVQSFKTFSASAAFDSTRIFGEKFAFEDLLATYFKGLYRHAAGTLDIAGLSAVVGRPVVFAGSAPDPALALRRYGDGFRRAGLANVHYAYEPVAAAYFFARRLKKDATVLVGDFGGGTSDFSIIRFSRDGGQIRSIPLGHSGVGAAGDAFDYQIIDHAVSPLLGKGTSFRSYEKVLPIPNQFYAAFAKWNQLALMKGSKQMREITSLLDSALDPEALERLIEVLENGYHYSLFRAVSAAKETLSSQDYADLRFTEGNIDIKTRVHRQDFERWIGRELDAIRNAVDTVITGAGLSTPEIDKVYLTGGSSFVPAVRSIFIDRFGAEKIESGEEFESIASGLALIGSAPDRDQWLSDKSAA